MIDRYYFNFLYVYGNLEQKDKASFSKKNKRVFKAYIYLKKKLKFLETHI